MVVWPGAHCHHYDIMLQIEGRALDYGGGHDVHASGGWMEATKNEKCDISVLRIT